MGQHSLPGTPPVPLRLRTSARARRITLRVSSLDGTVTLTVPKGIPESEALAFAREKETWLRGHLAQQDAPVDIVHGAELPIEGQMHDIVPGTGRSVRLENGCVVVPGAAESCGARLKGFLKTLARTRLSASSDLYAQRLGQGYNRLTLRDTRSRWGSCTSDGGLMYSWRLILAPPEVLAYVAAHEVAHLAEMNHSPDFWQVVERIHGPYEGPRGWLRREGAALHRIRFG